jgi:hypothetical protein
MILSDKARRPSLFADPEGEAARRFFDVPSDPAERRHACAIHLGAGLFRQVRLADRRSRLQQARASHCGAYADRLGARRTALLRRPMPKSSPGGFPARGSS